MPLHPQAQTILDLMASLGTPPLHTSEPQAVREARGGMGFPSSVALHEIRDLDAGGIPARVYRPTDQPNLGLLVYFHGGGWVLGNLDGHDDVCRRLAAASGHAVLSVDYRLAPEHPFPAPVEDAVTATRWAHSNAASLGCTQDMIAVGGDSAGGNLAAVVANMAPVPLKHQLLIYPVTDCTCSFPSFIENADGYFLTADSMDWFIGHYLSGSLTEPTDPRVSPLFAAEHVIAAAPPAMVITAEFDPLRDEGDAYAAKLAEAGVPTSHVRFSGMIHGFVSMADFIDDGAAALAMAGSALAAAFRR